MFLSLCAAQSLAALAPAPPAPPTVATFDWAAFLEPCPAPGSVPDEQETAILLWLQNTRTRADVLRANDQVEFRLFTFNGVLGGGRDLEKNSPLTFKLMQAAWGDLGVAIGKVKNIYGRNRPEVEHPGLLKPAVPRSVTNAYPSAHAAYGMAMGMILAELDPPQRMAILEHGHRFGDDRVLGGAHHPSDVTAGQRMGKQFATLWLKEHRKEVDAVRAGEWQAEGSEAPGAAHP